MHALASALKYNMLVTEVCLHSPTTRMKEGKELWTAVASCPSLSKLSVHFALLGPQPCSILAQLVSRRACALQELSLNNTNIGGRGMRMLAAGLEVNSSIQVLSLQNCSIGEEGGTSLAGVLGKHPTMREVDLSWNSLGPNGSAMILHALGG
ncbi:hypothetical protein GUITHDRAFT_70556, partial [Guillardia theta CCMP2712]